MSKDTERFTDADMRRLHGLQALSDAAAALARAQACLHDITEEEYETAVMPLLRSVVDNTGQLIRDSVE